MNYINKMRTDKNLGFKIGGIFSLVSFLFAFTLVIPMYTIFPSVILDQAINTISPTITSLGSGMITILILVILLLLALIFTLKRVEKSINKDRKHKTTEIIILMFIFYFIVHNLGYYLFLGINSFPIDALNMIYAAITFPFSSLSFVIIGFMIDWYRKKTEKTIQG